MEKGRRPLSLSLLSFFLAVTGIATAAFWVLFFSKKIQATETQQDEAFERAFPLADSWMIACALVSAKNILKMNKKGFFAGAAAASALIFLGCMDILYSLENRKYIPLNKDRAQMLFIHIWTILLGSISMSLLWKKRDLFIND